MFHKIKSVTALPNCMLLVHFSEGIAKKYDIKPLFEKYDAFKQLQISGLFPLVSVDAGGYGVSWNDDIDLSCNELWDNGKEIPTQFDSLIAFGDATDLWRLNESTLRKAISYGKLTDGIDVKKFGKQWVITKDAMLREYGQPPGEKA